MVVAALPFGSAGGPQAFQKRGRFRTLEEEKLRNTVAPRCNESQEFRFFRELSFVTARFWKKFLIARSVCMGAGV